MLKSVITPGTQDNVVRAVQVSDLRTRTPAQVVPSTARLTTLWCGKSAASCCATSGSAERTEQPCCTTSLAGAVRSYASPARNERPFDESHCSLCLERGRARDTPAGSASVRQLPAAPLRAVRGAVRHVLPPGSLSLQARSGVGDPSGPPWPTLTSPVVRHSAGLREAWKVPQRAFCGAASGINRPLAGGAPFGFWQRASSAP
jgi:hypothetical protein